jgi:hypothetical protein
MMARITFVLLGVFVVIVTAGASFDQGLNYALYWTVGVGLILYGLRLPWRGDQSLIIRNRRYCARCGYDVHACSSVCSECGTPIIQRAR